MRYQGKITSWKDEQGFGFISPNGGGKQVFVHISAFSNRHRRPINNAVVTYEVNTEANNKLRAEHVKYVDEPARSNDGKLLLVFAIAFLACMSASVFFGKLPKLVFWLYVAASSITFIAYKRDKLAARSDQSRTPEKILHMLALLGGWPGAILAQRLFRHKSKKLSFQITFWATVMLNCLALAWLLYSQGTTLIDLIVSAM